MTDPVPSNDEPEALEDTLELLSDPEAMDQLRQSREAHEAGDYVMADELRTKYQSSG